MIPDELPVPLESIMVGDTSYPIHALSAEDCRALWYQFQIMSLQADATLAEFAQAIVLVTFVMIGKPETLDGTQIMKRLSMKYWRPITNEFGRQTMLLAIDSSRMKGNA